MDLREDTAKPIYVAHMLRQHNNEGQMVAKIISISQNYYGCVIPKIADEGESISDQIRSYLNISQDSAVIICSDDFLIGNKEELWICSEKLRYDNSAMYTLINKLKKEEKVNLWDYGEYGEYGYYILDGYCDTEVYKDSFPCCLVMYFPEVGLSQKKVIYRSIRDLIKLINSSKSLIDNPNQHLSQLAEILARGNNYIDPSDFFKVLGSKENFGANKKLEYAIKMNSVRKAFSVLDHLVVRTSISKKLVSNKELAKIYLRQLVLQYRYSRSGKVQGIENFIFDNGLLSLVRHYYI